MPAEASNELASGKEINASCALRKIYCALEKHSKVRSDLK